ncbi:MAG: diguanylate cyclase [Aliidiomarina sp.]|uniref:sensor domain-containing diguanylate cyclase n=1 Tax=Aliidiomarina sp. TaxID=1872439 RepID=UPI0025C5255D|nr:diguanylate cyclase [Aliidiomarina sp.]MCH8501118.1 diguanylate cyclase [Aliidiomarina sp.]
MTSVKAQASSRSLRSHFVLVSAGMILALTLVLSSIAHHSEARALKSQIGNALIDTSMLLNHNLDQFMWARSIEVELLSQFGMSFEDPDEMRDLLEAVQEKVPSFAWFGVTDSEGVVQVSTGGLLEGMSIAHRPVFTEARSERFYGDVHEAQLLAQLLPNPSGEAMKFVDISFPLFSDAGEFRGVLAAHLSWEWAREVQTTIMEPLRERHQIEFFVVSPRINAVLLGPGRMAGQELNLASLTAAEAGESGFLVEKWPDGERYFTGFTKSSGYRDFPGFGWSILLRENEAVAVRSVTQLQIVIWSTSLLFILLFAFIAWRLSIVITEPLQEITQAAHRLSKGKIAEIPLHKGIREIESLEQSLRDLLVSLTRAESALGEMESKAHRDALTGLANRNALTKYLKVAREFAEQRHQSLTLLYLDLDKFKPVNDTYGHAVGDALLQQVAQRLRHQVRQDELAVRLGGDEFLLVLTTDDRCPEATGEMVAERVLESLRQPFQIEQLTLNIGSTIGIAIWPQDGEQIEEVLELADQALYRAKQQGRNRYLFANNPK